VESREPRAAEAVSVYQLDGLNEVALRLAWVAVPWRMQRGSDGGPTNDGRRVEQMRRGNPVKRESRKKMGGNKRIARWRSVLSLSTSRTQHLISVALVTLGICAAAAADAQEPTAPEPEEEYGEFLARAEELASIPVNDIFRSMRLTAGAMLLGKKVYEKNCATCHGADLKGVPDQHTPDLTDGEWRFSGDDLTSGGNVKFPSDVEWTVRYGIPPRTRMRAGWRPICWLSIQNIALKRIRPRDRRSAGGCGPRRARRCFVPRWFEGQLLRLPRRRRTGYDPIGSTNLTRPDLYLWGSDRASIHESIVKGRRAFMPAFDGTLKPEEIQAVSIFAFSHAKR
jgi:mono/diheme cytochrome c family protein